MLISEVSKLTKLTKKAIEYYTLHGLITPTVLANGYKAYSENDIVVLEKIGVLRKLDLSIDDIKSVLNDSSNEALQAVLVKRELSFQRDAKKKSVLQKLSSGKPYSEISIELQSIEKGQTITEKLLDAFPGYYGRFICLHFSRFLDVPIQSEAQVSAYDTIISFLDNVPAMDIPKDLEAFLTENTNDIGSAQITEILESTKKSLENPDEFLSNRKGEIKQYLAYKQSAEYKASPAFKLMNLMKRFNSTTGYNDVFIPAMKQLSRTYSEYCLQMEIANEKLLVQFPEVRNINN